MTILPPARASALTAINLARHAIDRADLNGRTDFDDYTLFLAGYQGSAPATNWLYGDFDYGGTVTLDDFNQYSLSYNRTHPAPPTQVTATPNGAYGLDVRWRGETAPNLTYNVYVGTTANFTPGAGNLMASGVSGTATTVTGLSAGTAYYTVVKAVSTEDDGEGGTTSTLSFGTGAGAPGGMGGGGTGGGLGTGTTTLTPNDPGTAAFQVYGLQPGAGGTGDTGVTAKWSDQAVVNYEPLQDGTFTLTLTGLPKHTALYVWYGLLLQDLPDGASTSMTVDGQPVDGAVPHTGFSATIAVTATGFAPSFSWTAEFRVSIARPIVTVSGGGDLDEGGSASSFRIERSSDPLPDQPLPVTIDILERPTPDQTLTRMGSPSTILTMY
jgi:hypothetical protein